MERKTDWIAKRQTLRADAEHLLSGIVSAEPATQATQVLLHELAVHKVELETQVEELRRAHDSMEEARDRYVDFYDFAPVGYITLSREGLIGEVNLTGTTLLGVGRGVLVNRRLSTYISPADRDRWHRFLVTMLNDAGIEKQAIVLDMVRADGSSFPGYIDCRCRKSQDLPPEFRLTLIDIGKIRQAETEMHIASADPDLHGE